MNPSPLRTPARCSLRLECGISARSWRASAALRMRVSISAIGSVIIGIPLESPARLDHARDFSTEREHAKAHTAKLELPVVAASAAAHLATAAVTDRELRCPIQLCELTSTRHRPSPSRSPEGHSQVRQKRAPFFIGFRCRHEGDVESLDDVDAVVVDLGKDDLFLETERVVPLAVERLARHAAAVAGAREGEADETVEELPHT